MVTVEITPTRLIFIICGEEQIRKTSAIQRRQLRNPLVSYALLQLINLEIHDADYCTPQIRTSSFPAPASILAYIPVQRLPAEARCRFQEYPLKDIQISARVSFRPFGPRTRAIRHPQGRRRSRRGTKDESQLVEICGGLKRRATQHSIYLRLLDLPLSNGLYPIATASTVNHLAWSRLQDSPAVSDHRTTLRRSTSRNPFETSPWGARREIQGGTKIITIQIFGSRTRPPVRASS